MIIKHITLYVKDMDRSLFFYNKLLGLKIVNEMKMEYQHLVFLGNDYGAQVELIEVYEKEYAVE